MLVEVFFSNSVEAMVVENAKGHELVTREDLDKVRRRLIAYA